LRWVASLTLALLLLYSRPFPLSLSSPDLHAWGVCLALFASNLALHFVPREVFRRQAFHFLLFLLDLVLVSVAVYQADASGMAFLVVLMLCILSGAVTGDARASFVFALFAGLFYLAQLRISVPTLAVLLDPGTLLKVPLLLVFSLTAGLMSHGAERTSRRRANTLLAFDRRLRITMSPEEVAGAVVDVLGATELYRRVALYLLDPDQVTLRRAGEATFPPILDERELPESLRSRFHRGRPVYAEHLFGERRFTRAFGLSAPTAFLVPANFSDRPLGLLVVEYRRPQIDSEPEAEFLGHLAERAALAIMNARMIQTAQESAIGLHSLLKMSEAVSSSLRIRDILGLLDEFCRRLVGVRACRLWVARSTLGANFPAAAGGAAVGDLVPLGAEPTAIEREAARRVLETGSELFLNTTEAMTAFAQEAGIANLMAIPLRTKDEVLGVLEAIDKPEPFNQRDHSLLAGLASQATIALVNARLYEGLEERADRIARLVQILGAEKHKLEHVLANMEEGVVLLDREGRVGLMNHAGRRLLAPRSRVELPAPAVEFGDALGLLPRLAAVLANDAPVRETLPHGERYYELSAARLKGEDGAIAVLRDITEMVRMDAMRSDFISHVSHELRTPLAAIVGSVKLILDGRAGVLTETQERLLNVVERESDRLIRLVNDILDLAKLEAGRTNLDSQEVDLTGVIAEAIEAITPLAEAKSIRLESTTERLHGMIECDPSLVRQVLQNLIGNAIKFTPEGGRVRIEAETGEVAIEVRVIDTGIGIPRDKWEAVFNKFEQVGQHKGPIKGTGLGLAICRQIIERHGGRIGVESEEGVGSTFFFTLPLGESGRGEMAPAA
jgi:signal transduction histidine kinase